jgi:hypothetical protein
MRRLPFLLTATLLVSTLSGATLPGFRLEKIGSVRGFLTSLAIGPDGHIYYTVTVGNVFRLEGPTGVRVAAVETADEGNAALLGLAFRGGSEVVLHYVSLDRTHQVLEVIDLQTGQQVLKRTMPCAAGDKCDSEHHGGNPIVTPDGMVFVGVGDFNSGSQAQRDDTVGGKILRMDAAGNVTEFARGFRNPFDMAWDAASGKLIVPDNGARVDDEIHLVGQGDNGGWPYSMGNETPWQGTVEPIYVFPRIIAPTGTQLLRGAPPFADGGLLLGSFVTKTLYYFPDLRLRPVPDPIEIFSGDIGSIIDVVQTPAGEILVASGFGIYKLIPPRPGDANGDGLIEADDLEAIAREILEGDGDDTLGAHLGRYRTSWGADVNLDGVIDARDLVALAQMRKLRHRPARP